MPKLQLKKARLDLQTFKFQELFIEELGWNMPEQRHGIPFQIKETNYTLQPIAALSAAMVYQVELPTLKDKSLLDAIGKKVQKLSYEHLIIFTETSQSKSVWQWIGKTKHKQDEKEASKEVIRRHVFIKEQVSDAFMAKVARLFIDISELNEEGETDIKTAADKLRTALDVEEVTKRFFQHFQSQHLDFSTLIEGIAVAEDRKWYASILLNRLMFIYFLQTKFLKHLSEKKNYLTEKLAFFQTKKNDNNFYKLFLVPLFFQGFAKRAEDRSEEHKTLLGDIPYLNGGLFIRHKLETKYPDIHIPNQAFANLFSLFNQYEWILTDEIGVDHHRSLNPYVLGYIFEKYINQKAFGAYYTPPEITTYLCQQTIYQLLLREIQADKQHEKKFGKQTGNTNPKQTQVPKQATGETEPIEQQLNNLLIGLPPYMVHKLLLKTLPKLRLLDPACGSGAFLVAALQILMQVTTVLLNEIDHLVASNTKEKRIIKQLKTWRTEIRKHHPSVAYYIKKQIITNNLYGVDIMTAATEIAKLRLFLSLIATAKDLTELEPLPNIGFNIMAGNSLIGLLQVNAKAFDGQRTSGDMFQKGYLQLLGEKYTAIQNYKKASFDNVSIQEELKQSINDKRKEAITILNRMLAGIFRDLKIKFEEQTWDLAKNKAGKSIKRKITVADIAALQPFHWGYEFSEVFQEGGFDAIITNPPWDTFKPNGKEFLQPLDKQNRITQKKMPIKKFKEVQKELLKDKNILTKWLGYLSQFPYVSNFYRKTPQYKNQISKVNGRKQGTDINLYKLFIEQSFNLLKPSGFCGIVVPSGIYTDLGSKQLRQLLFEETNITGLFGFENRKKIFEGVDSRFKFVALSFEKGKATQNFPSAFMQHDVKALLNFPSANHLRLTPALIKKMSPDSLSIMEFKTRKDRTITEKMLDFPMLGEIKNNAWNLKLTREFDMTNHSFLFKTKHKEGYLPLYEGKMIHQFCHDFIKPRYWVDEKEARKVVLGRKGKEEGQVLDYQRYRLGFRDIARNTDTRTLIAAILPPNCFAGNTVILSKEEINYHHLLFISTMLNSLLCDYIIRHKVNAHCNIFYVKQIPVPRLTAEHPSFQPIVEKAARLVCTCEIYADLWKTVMGTKWSKECGVQSETEQLDIRATLDATIAHIYNVTEEEFQHILASFPLVDKLQKDATMKAFKQLVPNRPVQKEYQQEVESNPLESKAAKKEFATP